MKEDNKLKMEENRRVSVDKRYCSSSFLMFRTIADKNKAFSNRLVPNLFVPSFERYPVKSCDNIDEIIRRILTEKMKNQKTAIMLSSGIDSTILARYLPEGTKAYTLRCIAKNAKDETEHAKRYADVCKLDHHIIDVTWDDYLLYTPMLMKHKGAPIHSIEPQIYKAALQAKKDGIDSLIFGESADCIFGGQSGLFSKNWLLEEFIYRYTYVMPSRVLKDYEIIIDPYIRYIEDNVIDISKFMGDFYYRESVGSYDNPCSLAGIEFIGPYTKMYLDVPLDLDRIKSGDSKYLVRNLYKKLYPNIESEPKTPMPREVDQWLASWTGPKRNEFLAGCIDELTGDQKWLVFALEWFLNLLEEWGY